VREDSDHWQVRIKGLKGEFVGKNLTTLIASLSLFAALALPVGLCAQSGEGQSKHKHHRFKLIDMGTFGGPQSYFDPNSGQTIGSSSPLLNNRGTVTGFADTSMPDRFAPNFCFVADCFVTHVFQWQNGAVTDLRALPGGESSASTWISANGLIAGLSENGETDPLFSGFPVLHAVLWQHGGSVDLGTLPEGGYESEANAVNSRGQVVGAALNTVADANSMASGTYWLRSIAYGYQTRAFLWEKGVMQDLGTLGNGTDAQAVLINERGQIVGYSYFNSSHSGSCFPLATASFIWEREKGMVDLGSFGGTCTLAFDLNNRGQVVGGSLLPGDQIERAFFWDHGSLRELGGSLGGNSSGAFVINESGQAGGFADLAGETTFHAVLWKEIGEITDLGVIGNDTCSFATSMNAKTQVVGASMPGCNFDNGRAFLWEDGSLFDLNTLIPSGSTLHLQSTNNINDRGEIVGTGLDASGNGHAFVLIPCDENHENLAGCDYDPGEEVDETQVLPAQVTPAPATSPANFSPAGMMTRFRSLREGRGRRYGTPQPSSQ
jgi:probable HAF family extracellular repeat protein